MNLDRLKYRYWQHTDWHDTNSPLEAVYCNAVDGCDPTIAVSDFEFCTGLKDNCGNLIYESDYVKANDIIYRVFWNKTKISLVNILNGDIIDISETITMEIVGNEHEKDNISEIPKNPKRSSD